MRERGLEVCNWKGTPGFERKRIAYRDYTRLIRDCNVMKNDTRSLWLEKLSGISSKYKDIDSMLESFLKNTVYNA